MSGSAARRSSRAVAAQVVEDAEAVRGMKTAVQVHHLRRRPHAQLRFLLDDDALAARLHAVFAPAATPALRAVLVRLPASAPRTLDLALRSRLLASAASARAWVVPVFQGN